jgi:hypothetical protein
MSNERERKLLPHEKPIWRKAFEASLPHMSVEGAERKAWHAVDIWKRVGAFNEPESVNLEPTSKRDGPVPLAGFREGWEVLATFIEGDSGAKHIADAMRRFGDGLTSINDFRNQLTNLEFDEQNVNFGSAWKLLIEWFDALPGDRRVNLPNAAFDLDTLVDVMSMFASGKTTFNQFKEDLREMFDGSD